MKPIRAIIQSSLPAIVLAILLMVFVYHSLQRYSTFLSQQERLETLSVRLRLSQNQLTEATRKSRLYNQVRTFMDRSRQQGLEPEKWTTYQVSIEEPITYEAFETILNQCNSTPLYTFKPDRLEIKARTDSEKNEAEAGSRQPQSPSDLSKAGDITIDLKGTFLVRGVL